MTPRPFGGLAAFVIFLTTGCPSGIGPEISVLAAKSCLGSVLIGDLKTLRAAAILRGVDEAMLQPFSGSGSSSRVIPVVQAGPKLKIADRKTGKPTAASGLAQLCYLEAAVELLKEYPGAAIATAPISKEAVLYSGEARLKSFRGHTEWLGMLDGEKRTTMCFASKTLATSLVTTHIPISAVSTAVKPDGVAEATIQLAQLVLQLRQGKPRIAVASLNPHAGEAELIGGEERSAILPGIEKARAVLGKSVEVLGPIGAETAYRKMTEGVYQGVVAMYHDQATIPMKLLDFGKAVNITMGLSFVRTSVDHGTAYDIAWRGIADPRAMIEAVKTAKILVKARKNGR